MERRDGCASTWSGEPLGTMAAWMTSAQSLMLLWMSSLSTLAGRGKHSPVLETYILNETSAGWALSTTAFPPHHHQTPVFLRTLVGFSFKELLKHTNKVWESALEARSETEESQWELAASSYSSQGEEVVLAWP